MRSPASSPAPASPGIPPGVCVHVTMVNQGVDPVFAYVFQSVADGTTFKLFTAVCETI